MFSCHDQIPHHIVTQDIVAVAMGRKPAELILKTAGWWMSALAGSGLIWTSLSVMAALSLWGTPPMF